MEIERKFLISHENLPADLEQYPFHKIQQGYLCTDPVVRIRKQDNSYYLTYKSRGLMAREEYNLPLTEEAYLHLKPKADGIVLSKTRYLIPEKQGLTIELDVFHDDYEGLLLAEVEFDSEEKANFYKPPAWFGEGMNPLPNVYIFANGQIIPVSQKSYANFPLVKLGQDAGSTAMKR